MNKAIILLLCIEIISCKGKKVVQDVQTTFVKKGTFTEELTEVGNVKAVNSTNINAPNISYRYGGLKITKIATDGKEVTKGDTVMVFDPSEIKKAIINAQQKLEIANIALAHAKEQIENKKKIQKEEIYQKTLNIKQLTATLDDATRSVNSLFVISPSSGIAILKDNWMTNQKWQVGDQPYSGTSLIELPDMDAMMAEVKINEVDIAKVAQGLKVEIKPDAFSDSTFKGKVTAVANLAQNKDSKSKIKIFPVQVVIDGKSKSLLPGLTVSCKIIIREIPGILYIPIDAIFKDQTNDFVYARTNSGFKRKPVKIGPVNSDFAIVSEGLKENEELALTDPYLNKEETKAQTKNK